MLKAQDSQFRLTEDGQVFYQAQASNPLPGEAIGRVEKGDDILKPKVVLSEAHNTPELREHLQGWLARHIGTVLEPLVALENDEHLKGAAKGIAFQVHEALGIVPRENLEDLIKDLTPESRADLRHKKIRLGPILVFIPALNKPAAVRLRALLWGLYNEKALPMDCPKDGIVSFEVEAGKVDKAFYQAIAYPVYGSRAIRIDMLDRVICAVYDAAKDGQFQAQHQMAEWLGASIDGLYEVLEAMGHKKVFDPIEEKAKEEIGAKAGESAAVEAAEAEPKADEKPAEQVKPELATFRLKKGKAFQKPQGAAKPYVKPKGKRNKTTNREPKIMSTGPEKKLENSPFAILEQLKQKSDG